MTLALPGLAIEALVRLRLAHPDRRFVLIGAAALSAHVPLHRATADMDLILISETLELRTLLEPLGWRQHPRLAHRYRIDERVVADVLPVNDEVLRTGRLELVPGVRLNMTGCDLALDFAVSVVLPGLDVSIEVASVPALVVLKIAAYLDRPFERGKDLGDIFLLLENALAAEDDRRWDDTHPVGASGVSYDLQSAFFVGHEVGRIAGPAHRALVDDLLARLADPGSIAFAHMLRNAELVSADPEQRLTDILGAFRQGFVGLGNE